MIALGVQSMVSVWRSALNDGLIRVLLYVLKVLKKLRIKPLNRKGRMWSRRLRRHQNMYPKVQYDQEREASPTVLRGEERPRSSSDSERGSDHSSLSYGKSSSSNRSTDGDSDSDSHLTGLYQRAKDRLAGAAGRMRRRRILGKSDEEMMWSGDRPRLDGTE
jgi:hypothetical protein